MNRNVFLAPCLALFSVATAPAAQVANATFGFGITGGVVSYASPSGFVADATSITLPTPNTTGSPACNQANQVCLQVNQLPATYLGNPNDFAPGNLTPLAIGQDVSFTPPPANPYFFDLSFATLPIFTFTLQTGDRFTFTASSGQKSGSTIGNSSNLFVVYLGTFSDTGGTYSNNAASLVFSLPQTGGAGSDPNFSGTFATPPAPGVPEPATFALMGSALLGLGLIGKKRFSRR